MKKEKKGLWIPQFIVDDANLDWLNKILYTEIVSLSSLQKGCIASNQHFADLLGLKSQKNAQYRIQNLKKMGYITISLSKDYGNTQRKLNPKVFSLEGVPQVPQVELKSSKGGTLQGSGGNSTRVGGGTPEFPEGELKSSPNNTLTNSSKKPLTNTLKNPELIQDDLCFMDYEAQKLIEPYLK
jgi:hypothetical protein